MRTKDNKLIRYGDIKEFTKISCSIKSVHEYTNTTNYHPLKMAINGISNVDNFIIVNCSIKKK
ncbi:MAG: hypothetical protein HON32_02570 [Francisellaceae bacterium]|mgnify:FL=1|nr:hypothetical protein [Francisellaceae bacterium]MBT6538732.1 hypothetical protein [Francisellaceae bacterium]